jgi:hypothetical protein
MMIMRTIGWVDIGTVLYSMQKYIENGEAKNAVSMTPHAF